MDTGQKAGFSRGQESAHGNNKGRQIPDLRFQKVCLQKVIFLRWHS